MLKDLTQADLSKVVVVHEAAFPKSALTSLGSEAVRRYYAWQLEGPHDCVALAFEEAGRLLGFCFGGVFRSATGGFVRRNRWFLARRMLIRPWLWSNPLVRSRVLGGLRLLSPPAAAEVASVPADPESPAFGILSIAVHPEAQGKGMGQALMAASEKEARKRGFTRMQLTVATDNETAIRFYEKAGWRRIPAGSAWSGKMEKPLKPESD